MFVSETITSPKNYNFVTSLLTEVKEVDRVKNFEKTPEKAKIKHIERIVKIRSSFEGVHYTAPSFSTGKKEVMERLQRLRNFP